MLQSRVETITPAIALKYLEQNTHNRPLTQGIVNGYAKDMKVGKWKLNGEPIIFDANKVLQDGQHRLWACIEGKAPFDTVVVRGVDPSVFSTIDTGKGRSTSDNLGIIGKQHSPQLAAATNLVYRYLRGTVLAREKVTPQDALLFVAKNADLEAWVTKVRSYKGFAAKYHAMLAATLFVGSRRYPQKAQEFMERFSTGQNLPNGSPILALRNRLLTDNRLKREERFALVALAWNAFVENRPMRRAQLPTGSAFPTIKGGIRV